MNIIICDDNAEELRTYSDLLSKIVRENNIEADITEYSSETRLLFDFEDIVNKVDVLFLDIYLPKVNGIEAARRIREMGYVGELIFLTHSTTHWVHAFDLEASNYMIKSEVEEDRFRAVTLKAIRKAENRSQEYLLVTGGGEHRQIPISSILFFELKNRIITVHYEDKSFEFFSNLTKLEERLSSSGFYRVHRSYLVAVSKISVIAYRTQGEVTMTDGTVIPVGRSQYSYLKDLLKQNGKLA